MSHCENCGSKVYSGRCVNCHEELYILDQYIDLDMDPPLYTEYLERMNVKEFGK